MPNIAYLNRKTKMGYMELLQLPYTVFLSLLVENRIMDLQETEEGREYLDKVQRLKVTTPDFRKLKSISGYKEAGGINE